MLYFGKTAAELNAIEAATLAGITQNPYKWDPLRFPENAQDRRDTVLGVMLEQSLEQNDPDGLTQEMYDEAIATPLADTLNVTRPKFSCVASTEAPFFCDYVTKVIALDPFFEGKGKEYLYYGVDIVTTLDINMQRIANEELRASIPPTDPTGIANALVAVDQTNGHILVMAQNRDFNPKPDAPGQTAINYSVDREIGGSKGFSPGSTFKVIILAEWLESGHTLNQAVSSAQRKWPSSTWKATCIGPAPFAGQAPWEPHNVGNATYGQVTALGATIDSINTAYVAMTNQMDLCGITDMAARLGFKRADGKPFETVPSVTLGTQNASPLTMAVVGATIANDGVKCETRSIMSITTRDGVSRPVPPDQCESVLGAQYAQGVQFAMTQVVAQGSGTAAKLCGRTPSGGEDRILPEQLARVVLRIYQASRRRDLDGSPRRRYRDAIHHDRRKVLQASGWRNATCGDMEALHGPCSCGATQLDDYYRRTSRTGWARAHRSRRDRHDRAKRTIRDQRRWICMVALVRSHLRWERC